MNRFVVVVATMLFLVSCAEESDIRPPETPDLGLGDLEEALPIKGDGTAFNHDNLIHDSVFADVAYLALPQVQAFLEETPYGTRCFLADFQKSDLTAAQIIHEAAERYRINPLIFLVKLQVETGMISKTVAPSDYLISRALGCACPDGGHCGSFDAGFVAQVDCAGELFRKYLDEIEQDGKTWTGWAPGKGRLSQDDILVTPANAATAALYTYTPWVLRGTGGNWLFWNVLTKYSRHLLLNNPNYHWIGGVCVDDGGCPFDNGTCLEEPLDGLCSRACEGYCPDTTAPFSAMTFCADLGTPLHGMSQGWCLARCDQDLFWENNGCRTGFQCVQAARYLHPEVEKMVCWPSELLVFP